MSLLTDLLVRVTLTVTIIDVIVWYTLRQRSVTVTWSILAAVTIIIALSLGVQIIFVLWRYKVLNL